MNLRTAVPRAAADPARCPCGTYIQTPSMHEPASMDSVERILWWLFGSGSGAATRIRLVRAINERPRNALQLSEALGLHYTTVRRQLSVLERNGLVAATGNPYGKVYFLSNAMESHWSVFEGISERSGNEVDADANK